MHDPSNAGCPHNVDPRNTCCCDEASIRDLEGKVVKVEDTLANAEGEARSLELELAGAREELEEVSGVITRTMADLDFIERALRKYFERHDDAHPVGHGVRVAMAKLAEMTGRELTWGQKDVLARHRE